MQSTTSLRYKPELYLPEGNVLSHIHCCFIHNSQKLETGCSATEEWVKKMGNIYIMEYYIAIKNDIIKFAGKWVEIENSY